MQTISSLLSLAEHLTSLNLEKRKAVNLGFYDLQNA